MESRLASPSITIYNMLDFLFLVLDFSCLQKMNLARLLCVSLKKKKTSSCSFLPPISSSFMGRTFNKPEGWLENSDISLLRASVAVKLIVSEWISNYPLYQCFFWKREKDYSLSESMWHLSDTCVLIAFSQHSQSFWLSPFLSSYLSQTGPVISWKLLPILLRLLLILHPSVFISGPRIHHRPRFQPTQAGISQGRRRLGFSSQ